MPDAGRSELEEINVLLKRHDMLYHGLDSPEITDAQYDELVQKKASLLARYPQLKELDSYSNNVGALVDNKGQKIAHTVPMLSLENAFTLQDVERFITRVRRILDISCTDTLSLSCEPKIDGLSFSALYKNGMLETVATRGNGLMGEDITNNAKALRHLPHTISTDIDVVEVRGEIYMHHSDFEKLKDSCNFANPRNAAAGSIRQLNRSVVEERNLRYIAYSIVNGPFKTQSDVLAQLASWGFCTNKYVAFVHDIEAALAFYNKMFDLRSELGFDIDGIVYKVDCMEYQRVLGVTGKYPRWAIAHKFPSTEAKTKLRGISLQVGRTGVITPIAELEPINIGGTVVSRASLHNIDEIMRKDIRVGDFVLVKRAGEVIPQITSVDVEARGDSTLAKYVFPCHCPVCGGKLHRESGEVAWRCTAELSCRAQVLERIAHFVSRDGLNIVGLGKKQIEFLCDRFDISSIDEIFSLEDKFAQINIYDEHGWGKKSVDNLLAAIKTSSTVKLSNFIYALGIRFIGKGAAKLVAEHYVSFNVWMNAMISLANGQQIDDIFGIGDKSIDALRTFFSSQGNQQVLQTLHSKLNILDEVTSVPNVASSSTLLGKNLVFTGVLSSMSRSEAAKKAQNMGANVVSAVSTKTDFLVVGADPGSKLTKAQDLGVKVIDETAWLELLKECDPETGL